MRLRTFARICVAATLGCSGAAQQTHETKNPAPPLPTASSALPPLGQEPAPTTELSGRPWLDAVHAAFHERWAESFLEQCRVYLPPGDALNDMSLRAELEFVVAGDGALSKVAVTKTSANPQFDAAALEVVRESAPFAAPPTELRSDDGFVYVSWVFARGVEQDGVAGAQVQRKEFELARALPMLLSSGRLPDAARRIGQAATTSPPPAGEQATALVGMGRELASAALEQTLGDATDAQARLDAARAARLTRSAALAPRLRALAQEAPDLELQRAAIEALGVLGDADSAPMLLDITKKLDGERSAAAVAALAHLGKRKEAWAILSPRMADAEARPRVLATLAELGEPASVGALADVLKQRSAARGDRVAAAHALGTLAAVKEPGGAEAVKALSATLIDGDAAVRAAAAAALARAGDRGLRSRNVFYKVLPLLKDRDPRVRASSALATAAVSPNSAAGELAVFLRKESDPSVQVACATALGPLPGADALAALTRLAASPAPEVRRAALAALAKRPEGRATLATLTADPEVEVRALAFGSLDDAGALAAGMADPAPEVRAAAIRALVRRNGPLGSVADATRMIAEATSARERVLVAEAWLWATAPQ